MAYEDSGGGRGGPGAVPSSTRIAGILLFVSGGLALLSGLLLLLVATLGVLYGLIAVAYLALGGFEVYLGVQLSQLMPWARTGAILMSAGSIVVSLLLVSRGSGSTIVGMILPAIVIVLMFRPDTLAAFPRSTKPLGI